MYYTIYKITNQINGKFYIGSHKTKDLDDNYMGSGKYLKHAQEKYGIENFKKEILFIFDTAEEMYAKEAEIVNEEFLSEENTYNLKRGGFGGWDFNNTNDGQKLREHSYSKWSKAGNEGFLKRYENDELFQTEIKDRLEKIRILALESYLEKYPNGSFAGKKHNSQTILKMKESAKGKHNGIKNSQYGTMWITNGSISKKISKNDILPDGWKKGRIQKTIAGGEDSNPLAS